ncbi:MAG: hypothetical protein GY801_50115, partial [bacterium]|nr:hypothetical protein [bacterium]
NTSYGTQEELFTALGTTDFERSGDNPKRVKGFRVAGYRVTREALTALFEEEVVKNHRLPAHIYGKLAGHESDRTICSSSCILGKEGEGWSFRNVDADEKNVEFTEVLQKALGDDYNEAYAPIIMRYADHIALFGSAIARHADKSEAYGTYRDRCENAVLEHGAAGVTKGALYNDYTTVEYESVQSGQDTQIVKTEIPPLSKHELSVQKEFADAPFQLRDNVYWQSAYRPDLDEVVTLSLTFGTRSRGGQVDIAGSVPITRRLKSRVLQQGITGDDVSMLQMALRQMGVSHPPRTGKCSNGNEWCENNCLYGDYGTMIGIDGSFGVNAEKAVNRLRKRDEIGQTGIVDLGMLKKIEVQWTDYLAALDAYSDTPTLNASHQDFDSWVEAGAQQLAETYTDKFVTLVDPLVQQDVQGSCSGCKESRERLLKKWVEKEASKGNWGRKVPFRTVIGECDSHGSIGFSQIQNRHKYGVTSSTHGIFADVNLYHPAEGIQGFALFSNDRGLYSNGGGGFYYAFQEPDGTSRASHKSKFYPVNPTISYPRLASIHLQNNSYTDEAADRLSKGIMAYNQGNLRVLRTEIWPEILRQLHLDYQSEVYTGGGADIKGIAYALDVKNAANLLEDAQRNPLRTWAWRVKVITTGSDGICQTSKEGDDEQILNVNAGNLNSQNQPIAHSVAIIGGLPLTKSHETLETTVKVCFSEPEYTNFLNQYGLVKEDIDPFIIARDNDLCFDLSNLSSEAQTALGEDGVNDLQTQNDDRIEVVEFEYSEEDWHQGISWVERLRETLGGGN